MSDGPPRYSWGVPSARGVALGLGPARLTALGGGLGLAALSLYLRLPVPLAVLPVLAGATWAWAPGGSGRSLHETATAAAGLVARRARSGSAPAPAVGFGSQVAESWWPAELADLRVEAVTVDGVTCGVLVEGGRPREATAVFGVVGDPRFRLLGEADQAAAVAGWAQVLAEAAAGSGVTRLQWVERARPQSPPEPAGPASYRALVADASAVAVEHRTLVAARVGVSAGDWSRAAGTWRLLGSRMAAAGLVAVPLGPAALAGTLREWGSGRVGDCDPALAGPGRWAERWRLLRTADRCHRAFEVVAWPRTLVGPAWLDPLLAAVPAGCERTLALHLEAVPAQVAARRLRAARTGAMVEDEHRARLGFVAPVGEVRRGEETETREAELAAGYVLHRVAAVVVVSAADEAALPAAGDEVVAAAAAAGVDLRPLDGCLPLTNDARQLPDQLRVQPWPDPWREANGFAPHSAYVELVWSGRLGPTTTLLYRRLGGLARACPEGATVDVADLGSGLGLGGDGRWSPLARSVGRLVLFGAARWNGETLEVRRALPPVPASVLPKLGPTAQRVHAAELARAATPKPGPAQPSRAPASRALA